jgi:hypothetical protein
MLLVAIVLLGWAARAEPTNNPPRRVEQSLQALPQAPKPITIPPLRPLKPNELVVGKRSYSGLAVQAARTRNPLQLINPLAPLEHGRAEDNVVRDPISRQPSGLKLFAIQF